MTHPDIDGDANREAVDGFADFDADDSYDASDPPPGEGTRGGGEMLIDLANVLRGAGLNVTEVDGWQFRERGGSGFPSSGPLGIIVHHTASNPSSDGQGDVNFITTVAEAKPLANLYLDRSARWWVVAAGATNTNGSGGPHGPIPQDSANSRVIGIEAGNNGIGEAWPEAMQDSYLAGVVALAERYRIDTSNILAHHEWAPTRKIDPAGPSRFGTINSAHSWNMDTFRAEVDRLRGRAGIVRPQQRTAKSGANIHVVKPGDTWWRIAQQMLGDPATNWPKLAAANGGNKRVLHPGDVLTIPGRSAGSAVPAFPGEARLGDKGATVLAWQNALIAHGVIRDNAANRDSDYGEGMKKAVLELQQSWDWSDADGIAGKHTWKRLHGR